MDYQNTDLRAQNNPPDLFRKAYETFATPKALWGCGQELALLLAGRKPTQKQPVVFARLTSTGTSFLLPGLGLPHHPLVHTICHLDEINVVMTNAHAFPAANFPPGCCPPCIHHATQGFGVLGAGIGVGVKGIFFPLPVPSVPLPSHSCCSPPALPSPSPSPTSPSAPEPATILHFTTCRAELLLGVGGKLVLLLPKKHLCSITSPPSLVVQKKSESQSPREPTFPAVFCSAHIDITSQESQADLSFNLSVWTRTFKTPQFSLTPVTAKCCEDLTSKCRPVTF